MGGVPGGAVATALRNADGGPHETTPASSALRSLRNTTPHSLRDPSESAGSTMGHERGMEPGETGDDAGGGQGQVRNELFQRRTGNGAPCLGLGVRRYTPPPLRSATYTSPASSSAKRRDRMLGLEDELGRSGPAQGGRGRDHRNRALCVVAEEISAARLRVFGTSVDIASGDHGADLATIGVERLGEFGQARGRAHKGGTLRLPRRRDSGATTHQR